VDVGEAPGWNGNVLRPDVDVQDHLSALTVKTVVGPASHILGHASPNIPGRNEASHCSHAGVGHVVEVVKHLMLLCIGNQRAKLNCGGVAKQLEGPTCWVVT
jgi:hypothetical protein